MSVTHKRRVMYTVLSEVVDEPKLWDLMWNWQDQYSDKSQFELNRFLADCASIPAVAQQRSNLYRQLIGLLMEEKPQLKEDPIESMLDYREQFLFDTPLSTQQDLPRIDWSEPLTAVIKEMFGHLRSDTAKAAKRYVIDIGHKRQLPSDLLYAFTMWSDHGQVFHVPDADLEQWRRLLNYVYIGFCELLGPVESDRILSSAIQKSQPRYADINLGLLLVER